MRKSAEVRREEILTVAVEQPRLGSYHGTSTEVIARRPHLAAVLSAYSGPSASFFLACNGPRL